MISNPNKRKVLDKIFIFDSGLEVPFNTLKEMIIKVLKKEDGLTTGDIAKKLGINAKQLTFVLPALSTMGDIDIRLDVNSAFYFIPPECPLQNILHPKPKFGDRILSTTRYSFK
jgi:pyruvate kinase